jgi:hypothetical protein
MRWRFFALTAALVAGLAGSAAAQTASDRVPSGAVVVLELGERLNSATAKRGDVFVIRLSNPIKVGETIVVPAGATGRGEVIDAKPVQVHAFQFNYSAKLLLAARYLDFDGARIPLRGFHLSAAQANEDDTFHVAGIRRMAPNYEAILPEGLLGEAKIAVDLDLKGHPIAVPAAAASTPN